MYNLFIDIRVTLIINFTSENDTLKGVKNDVFKQF